MEIPIVLTLEGPKLMTIDWTNPDCPITEHFSVRDACFLHNWSRLATQADGMDTVKLQVLCNKLEQVRTILNVPMNVHCIFRSADYNKEQHILMPTGMDVHAMSEAVDFDCTPHFSIEETKAKLLPHLEELQIRMEYGTTTWVHLDLHKVGPSGRYFHV